MNERKSKKIGIIATTILHTIVFACLYAFTLGLPNPPFPEPSGIEVNFGEEVIGDDVPGNPDASEDVSIQDNQNAIPQKNSQQASPAENLLTQKADNGQTLQANPKPTDTKPIVDTKPKITPEEQAKIDQQQAFIKQQQALANKNLKGTPGNGGTNTGQWCNSTTGSKTGTPGHPNGTLSTNTRGTPGNPYGNGDIIGGFVKPQNTQNCNKIVEFTVKIDSQGNVISVTTETAESDQSCIQAAKKAAMQAKYKPDSREFRYAKIIIDYTTSQK